MSDNASLSRRGFLILSATAAASLLVRSQPPEVMALSNSQQILLAARLAALFTHTESAKVIGHEYLQKYPQEASIRVLFNQVTANSTATDVGLFGATGQDLRGLLDRMIRADFEVDRVVKLQGWILSVTEARLCALATLL
jgi:hypothetical protein